MTFRGIVEASIRNRGWVLGLSVVVAVMGLYETRHVPIDVLPELTRPTVTLQTETAGLTPEDVEALVTFPLERAVSGLQDVARIRSVSTPGLSVVYAEFGWGSDVFRDRQLVAERVDAIRPQLPSEAIPRIGPPTSLMGEILLVALSISPDGHDAMAVRDFADWTLRPRLLGLQGIAQVLCIGGAVRQYEIRPDAQRLQLNSVSLSQVEDAARGFGNNAGAGYGTSAGLEVGLRSIGRPFHLEDLLQLAVAWRPANETSGSARGPIRLGQVADVVEGTRLKRGDAGLDGRPAVILSIQKQPGADTLALTRAVETLLAQDDSGLPAESHRITLFRQADFIHAAIDNDLSALLHGALIVAGVLFLFLAGGRATAISLVAIPLSVIVTLLVLKLLGLSINTMTLGGLAIAIGELVDDAVVGVENAIRRLRQNAATQAPKSPLRIVAEATVEVRSGILYATLLIVLAFLPLFALDGIEGRLFVPLALAYITAISASLVVAATVTPALTAWGFPASRPVPAERRWFVVLKALYIRVLGAALAWERAAFLVVGGIFLAGALLAAKLPKSFLPAFNERTLTVTLLLAPGVALEESDRIGRLAENLALQVPDVSHVGRRTGRAEFDEHAEGLHYSELDIALKSNSRPRGAVVADLRARLASLPGSISFGQPISHRMDHLLSGVQAPLAVKIFGEDFEELRHLADQVQQRLNSIPGLSDVQTEAQAEIPQLSIHVDTRRAAEYGASPPRVQEQLAALTVGKTLSQIVEGERRVDLVLRLPQTAVAPKAIRTQLIDTPAGPVPLQWLADVTETTGPNQILRENLQRRLVVSAQRVDAAFVAGADEAAAQLPNIALPTGYALHLEGEALEQKRASRTIVALGLVSLALMIGALQIRYRSFALVAIVLGSVPLALSGGVFALALTRLPLSIASLIGFVTLAGIASRNGILKLSHYLSLIFVERVEFGSAAVLRGSAERLAPVMMTASIAALGIAPLLIGADVPGREILHPVAVVIFGGLVVGTLLDSFVTPLLFLRFGRPALERLRRNEADTIALT